MYGFRVTYRHVPRYLPSYAEAHREIKVRCKVCNEETPKLAKNTTRCPEHQRAFAAAQKRKGKV